MKIEEEKIASEHNLNRFLNGHVKNYMKQTGLSEEEAEKDIFRAWREGTDNATKIRIGVMSGAGSSIVFTGTYDLLCNSVLKPIATPDAGLIIGGVLQLGLGIPFLMLWLKDIPTYNEQFKLAEKEIDARTTKGTKNVIAAQAEKNDANDNADETAFKGVKYERIVDSLGNITSYIIDKRFLNERAPGSRLVTFVAKRKLSKLGDERIKVKEAAKAAFT